MKILITGGAGFIGSHVGDIALEKGYNVVCIDNLSKGSIHNIRHNLSKKGFEFYKLDIMQKDKLFEVANNVDVIIHLAAYKIPRYGSAMKTLLINSQGTINVLELARVLNAKIIIASTSDVYGKNPQLPFAENGDLVLGPSTSRRWAYAVSKLFDEHLAYAYSDEYGIRITILRYFGTYGERQYLNWWGGPQGVFLDAIFNDKPVTIHGDGRQTRSFIYIKDAAKATILAAEREEAVGEIINIGSTEEIEIIELARLMYRLSGVPYSFKVKYVPYSSLSKNYEDVKRRVPDITKMKQLLGFEPKTTLSEGLIKLIEWYKEVRKNEL